MRRRNITPDMNARMLYEFKKILDRRGLINYGRYSSSLKGDNGGESCQLNITSSVANIAPLELDLALFEGSLASQKFI